MKMKDLIVVESAYEDGINDGKRGHRNPRASSIYGPSSDHYEKGYQHGVVLGKKEGEKNARRYHEWLKPFLHLSNEELHDLAEKFRTSPEDRMANGQPYPYNSKFQAIHQVLGHRKHNPNYGLDSEQDMAENVPIELLKEEESDYYRDYKHGLISYDEYKQLVNQFQGRSRHRHHSSYNTKPVMTGMYFYDVKPDEEHAADLYGIKKTKSGKWALIQYDTSGRTFNWNKQRADQRFGPGKFWSPKKESISETMKSKLSDWRKSITDKYPDAEFHDPRGNITPKDGSYHQIATVNGKNVGEIKGNHFQDMKLKEVALKMLDLEIMETATAGATMAANIGTVDAPQLSPGKARGKKKYIGSPGKSGTKAPPQPKVVQPKTKMGTAVNGLDIKGSSLFGGPRKKASVIKRR